MNKSAIRVSAIGILVAFAMGCATSSKDIATSYVSPMQYNQHDCQQLALEANRVSQRAGTLAGELDQKASNDAAKMGIGLVLFWPTLFFLDGKSPQEGEFARLKGEHEALVVAMTEKKCEIIPPAIKVVAPTQHEAKADFGPAIGPADLQK